MPRRSKRAARRRVTVVAAIAEACEPRRLLSASSLATNGTLTIGGTAASERFAVTLAGTDLVVTRNGRPDARFAYATVRAIDAIDRPTTLNGAAGDDTLRGRGGDDRLVGGSGLDAVIYGVDGSLALVVLNGTAGGLPGESDTFDVLETLVGTDAADDLHLSATPNRYAPASAATPAVTLRALGGAGDDAIVSNGTPPAALIADGGAGDDSLGASGGAAGVLVGGDGDDRLRGASGDDGLIGGAGNDSLYGNAGDDRLDGGGGRDLIDGGEGVDSATREKRDRAIRGIESLL